MKVLNQKTILAVLSAGLLASCGPTALVSTPIENIDAIALKTSDLSDTEIKEWSHLDLVSDTIPGMSVNKAYAEILSKRGKGQKVIVAVVDSGVDIEHEDLNDVIWTNPGEIAGNGKDDDGNGFIDDVHGWNFLGDTVEEQLEKARIVKLNATKNLVDAETYAAAQEEVQSDIAGAKDNKARYQQISTMLSAAHDKFAAKLGKQDYTKEEANAVNDASLAQDKGIIMQMFQYEDTMPKMLEALTDGMESFENQLKYNYSLTFDGRSTGDDPYVMDGKVYGNGDVDGPTADEKDARHGTHVAGIIAAERNNGLGMNGVANNVDIMVVRAVPDGDEYDKDIAMAIRYAADNGAKVMNASFGKYFSPNSEWVYEAIKYAESKDMLIVNAAGNEGLDLDTKNVYPNDQKDNGKEVGNNFLTVGALNYKYGSELVANFSNYGTINVDVFGPGVRIWSTTPLNEYEYLQGTSMAAPNVAGVAAVIRSQYPKLSASEVKQILMDSGLPSKASVILGGDNTNTRKFETITTSGKMVNMYNALLLAEQRSK